MVERRRKDMQSKVGKSVDGNHESSRRSSGRSMPALVDLSVEHDWTTHIDITTDLQGMFEDMSFFRLLGEE